MIAFRPPRASTAALAAVFAATLLSGCTDARRALGYEKAPPDEFAVVSRAPLSQPPDFTLRPPAPGAPRPQEGTPADQARAALTPGKTVPVAADISPGEKLLLVKSGADKVTPDIRRLVNEETTAIVEADSGFTDKLLFWQTKPLPGDVITPADEVKRLRENAALGKPPAAGDSVIIQRDNRSILDDLF